MLSPMPGQVIKVLVNEGEEVETNEPLIVLEAMKMEHTIRSNCKGVVKKVFFNQGDLVGGEVELLELEPARSEPFMLKNLPKKVKIVEVGPRDGTSE